MSVMIHRLRFLMMLAALLCVGNCPLLADADPIRTRYLGSSLLAIPTGYTQTSASYINDDSHSLALYSQQIWGTFLEMSALHHLDGRDKGKNILNLKVNLLQEDDYLPNVVWGVADYKAEFGSKVFFFAASKTLSVFGARVHGGFYKDPVTTDKKPFVGLDKTILPLVAIAAERVGEQNTFGLRLNPYPGVSVEYARRLRGGGSTQQNLYKVTYSKTF